MKKSKGVKHCHNCDKELPYHNEKFCSVKCNREFIYKNKPSCLNCKKKCNNKYCSRECLKAHRAHHLVCSSCKKEFIISDKWRIKQGKVKYCSFECRKRRYGINIHYFDQLDEFNLITLGQLIITGHIVDYRTFQIISDERTILDISSKLESTYPLEVSHSGLFRIEIISSQLILRLIELGIVRNCLYQDVPDDLWDGMSSTHCYSVADDGVNIFRTNRSKVALWVRDKFGGKMDCITGKDVYKGVMMCEWVVVWK
jgi:hypothetical protein